MTTKPDSWAAVKLTKLWMGVTRMWPSNYDKFEWYYFPMALYTVFELFLGAELVKQRHNFRVMTSISSFLISAYSYTFKHFIFLYKRKSFLQMIEAMNDPIFTNYPDELNEHVVRRAEWTNRITKSYIFAAEFVTIFMILNRFFHEPFVPIFIFTVVPLELYQKYILHVAESIWLVFGAWNNSCLDALSAGCMSVATAHFIVLRGKIRWVKRWAQNAIKEEKHGLKQSEEDLDEIINHMLGECVIHHMAIIEFMEKLEGIFSYAFLAQFLGSILVICNSCFQLYHTTSLDHFTTMIIYLSAMLTQLALYCWFGNELMLESQKLSDACYLSDWIEFGPKVRQSLMLIMERSKRPVYLTAGKFAFLSIESFKSILKSAYSYFALMETLDSKKNH